MGGKSGVGHKDDPPYDLLVPKLFSILGRNEVDSSLSEEYVLNRLLCALNCNLLIVAKALCSLALCAESCDNGIEVLSVGTKSVAKLIDGYAAVSLEVVYYCCLLFCEFLNVFLLLLFSIYNIDFYLGDIRLYYIFIISEI